MEPSPTKIKMRQVGVGFVFGDFMTNHSILVINRMEYSTTQSVATSFGFMFKHQVTQGEVWWWLEEQSKCNTSNKHFFFELPDNAFEYPWVDDKVIGTPSRFNRESLMKYAYQDVGPSSDSQVNFHWNIKHLLSSMKYVDWDFKSLSCFYEN